MYLIYKIVQGVQYRLCKDDSWRSFANYGTYPECVKEYRSLSFAKKNAIQKKALVVEVNKDVEIDACGRITLDYKSIDLPVIFDGSKV